ncbi:MAG TPA: OsmC family protein [Gemmatimonadales bacterium]|nr:OsmC family protein [Gemmatimonadales bacterium]
MLSYTIQAHRTAPATAEAFTGEARLALDVDPAGRTDAFNPAELLLTAIAACMLKGIERVAPMLNFELRGAEVRVYGEREDSPPRMSRIDYELVVDTDESDARLSLLHRNIQKYGTIYNTVSAAVPLNGTIRRAGTDGSPAEASIGLT